MSEWMSITDAAARLRLHDRQVRELVIGGELAGRLVRDRWEVSRTAVEQMREQADAVLDAHDETPYHQEKNR
ncbi:hypothetical protein IMZ11_02775 [Microtetraspora sp. AC03309]|uniref:helix-turn-helix domain-containing protein n=1 Tax=Microtetraspora sp. AC03309 TaxID=2779376 RepID=UPI001E3F829C|nr:hypothetical protein [Microtetraspora sp. AC03309]MCC5574564.1 hypothetical protein [Microtetraspora sp. AC03309]